MYFRSKEQAPKGYRRVRQNRRSQRMIVRGRIVQWRENPEHQPQDEQKHISVHEKVFTFYMCTYEHICNYQQTHLKVILLLLSSHLSIHICEMS